MADELKLAHYGHPVVNGLWLKILGFALTLVDHVGLLFSPYLAESTVTILRAIGRPAFPIFVFLAMEGLYHTHDYWKYFLRLFLMAIVLDSIAYGIHYGLPVQGAEMEPGNVFTDLALGTLTVYLLKREDSWSWTAFFPAAFLILSDFSVYHMTDGGTIKYVMVSDYGTFGLVLFLAFYLAYEMAQKLVRKKARELDLDYGTLAKDRLRLWINLMVAGALLTVELLFDLLWRYFPTLAIVPSLRLGGMALESWSTLALIPILLYDGRPGVTSRPVRYSLYLFYPVHLVLLWLLTLAL